jgi:glycosyltransferase involved in cell wall biosynthesis
MKIAIDCRKISDGGIGTYLQNVLACWQARKMPGEFFLFHNSADRDLFDPNFAKLIACDIPKYSVSELFSFAGRLREIKPDIFYIPHYTLPFNIPCRSVITIHDLIHFQYPGKAGLPGKLYARFMVRHACKKADTILTVSRYSQSKIAAEFPSATDKIVVVYPAVDHFLFRPYPENQIEDFRAANHLPVEFVLYVGALKPHKNPGALVEIVKELGLPLVIACQNDSERNNFIAQNREIPDRIAFVSLGDKKHLALLYNAAKLLIHPAFIEGFGLPPLEAMACGLPVVCSNSSSLPEVVGDASFPIVPGDYKSILEAVNLCWRDDNLRNILQGRGFAKAKEFDWGKTADGIFDSFIEVLGK